MPRTRIIFEANTFIRVSPMDLDKPPVGIHYKGTVLEVDSKLYKGVAINGNSNWYKDLRGFYFWSGGVKLLTNKRLADSNGLPNHSILPSPPNLSYQKIKSVLLSKYANTASGLNIAILDSGANTSLPDLQGVVVAQENFCGDDQDDVSDALGHGTQLALDVLGRCKEIPQLYDIALRLFIAKVKIDTHYVNVNKLLFALDWATGNDVDIIIVGHKMDEEKLSASQKISLEKISQFAQLKEMEIIWAT